MTGSRTIKVLVALIAAMTVGAVTLRALETKPTPLSITELTATEPFGVAFQADVPIKTSVWRNIVIHSTGPERADITSRVHFVIDANGQADLIVHPTALWKSQRAGTHVFSSVRNYNSDSIGICLRGDFSTRPPTASQYRALVDLVRALQQSCDIPAQNVFMYRPDLNSGASSPGKAFPVREFSARLLR
jgi:hypothetical protein